MGNTQCNLRYVRTKYIDCDSFRSYINYIKMPFGNISSILYVCNGIDNYNKVTSSGDIILIDISA